MRPKTVGRILLDSSREGSWKDKYRRWRGRLQRWGRLLRPANNRLAVVAAREHINYLFGRIRPVAGETRVRAKAAAEWLARAQDATPDDGVSAGYFPCDRDKGNGWRPSYPETTGYIIPSLLEYAERYDAPEMRERGLRMALWETEIQMESGAVQGGFVCDKAKRRAAVFNTGMVLQGYLAAIQASSDEHIRIGAERAADFLVKDQTEDGHFRTHGPFVRQENRKTYNCLCAWPLLAFGDATGGERYTEAAIRAVEAAVREQRKNGWFEHNCLTRSKVPLLHTIGYTLQGILEVGVLAKRVDFVDAVRRGVDPILSKMSRDGFLHGRYYADWEPGSFSSCLTGNAQLAVVCFRLYEQTGEGKYLAGADRLMNFLKALQVLNTPDDGIRGALAGSYPIMSEYQSAGYPNWAVKYLLDGLMLQDRLSTG